MSFILPPKPFHFTFQIPPFYIYGPQTLQAVRSQSDSLIHGPRLSCPVLPCPPLPCSVPSCGWVQCSVWPSPALLPSPSCWLTSVLKVKYCCPFHTGINKATPFPPITMLQDDLPHKMPLITRPYNKPARTQNGSGTVQRQRRPGMWDKSRVWGHREAGNVWTLHVDTVASSCLVTRGRGTHCNLSKGLWINCPHFCHFSGTYNCKSQCFPHKTISNLHIKSPWFRLRYNYY